MVDRLTEENKNLTQGGATPKKENPNEIQVIHKKVKKAKPAVINSEETDQLKSKRGNILEFEK